MMYLIYMAVFLGLYAVFKNHIFVAYILITATSLLLSLFVPDVIVSCLYAINMSIATNIYVVCDS